MWWRGGIQRQATVIAVVVVVIIPDRSAASEQDFEVRVAQPSDVGVPQSCQARETPK